VELLEHPAAGLRHWLVVPRTCALLAARQVTAVGFFGDLRPEVNHGPIYQLEADIVGRLPRYAAAGLLAYYDDELERGMHGNLVLFGTPEVPPGWVSVCGDRSVCAGQPGRGRGDAHAPGAPVREGVMVGWRQGAGPGRSR